MPDILTDADMADATPVLTDADMTDATPVVAETPPVLTDADMVDAKPVTASASPQPDVLTDDDMFDATPVAQPSAPMAPAVGAQPVAPMQKIGAGERIRLSRKAETGRDASTLEAIGSQLTLGAQPVVDVINKSALQQLASGKKKTFFRGDVPFSELPDYEISNMAKMANLDMPFMDSPLKQWDKTKGAAITDPKMRRAERAKFIQTEATNELKRRLQGKMEAGEKLSKSDQTLWARLAGGAVDNTGYTGAFMRGPVGAVLGPVARRYGDLQTDEQTLVDGKIETTEKGDTQGTAMAKGAAGGSAEYAIEKFGTEAANFILGNTLKRIPGLGPALAKAGGTAAGKVIANVAQKFKKLGEVTGKQNLAGEIFAEELPQQLVDVGLGLDKRESAKLMGIGSDTAEAFKSFVKPENVGNMALEMLLMQAAQGTAASVSYYDAYSKDRNRLDGTLTAFGANPDLVKKASVEEKRGVLKALSDKLTPDKATAILDKLGKRAGDLHDNIVKQEGYDFDANQYGITSRFALPAEGEADAWGTLDDGSKLYEGTDSGIGLVARPDGTATLYGRDGTVEDFKSVAEAADAANKLSVRDQVNDVRRGQKSKFVESTAKRLAPDVNVRVHNTTEDLLEAVPAVKDSPDFEDNPSGIAIGDTIHVVLDNIETPRGVVSTILHEAGVHAGLGRVLKGEAKKQFLGNLGSDAVKKYEEATSKMGYMQGAGNTEEALAYMYEQRLANPTGFQRGISWLHNQLRKVNPNYNFTDSDIEVMLADAQRSVRNAQRGAVAQPAAPVQGKARETAEMNAYERKALELEESYPKPAPAPAKAGTLETVQTVQTQAPKLDLNAESQKRMNEDPQAWIESLRATKGDIGKAVSVYDSLREESSPAEANAQPELPIQPPSPVKAGRPVLHSLEWFIENGMSPEAAQMAYEGERGQGKTEAAPVVQTPVQPEPPKVDITALLDSEQELVSQRLQARMKRDEWSAYNKLRTDGKNVPESENPFIQPFKDASKKLTAVRQSIYKADPSLKPVFGEKQEKESFKSFFDAMNQNGEFDLLQYWHDGRGLFAAPDRNKAKDGMYDAYSALPKALRKIITGRTKQTPDQVAKEIAGMEWGKPEYADSKTGPEALVSDWVYQYNRYLAWKAEGAPSLSEIEGRRYEAAHKQEQEDLATYRQKVDNGDVLADGSLVWARIDGQAAKQAGIDPEYPVVRIIGSKVKDGKLVYKLESVNHEVVTVFADAIEGDYVIQEEVDYDEPTRTNLEREDAAPDVPAGEVRDDSGEDVEDAEREAIQWEASLQSPARAEEAGKEGGSGKGEVAAPALTLESASIEELDAEKKRRAESEDVRRRADKQITGTAGDMTGTLPGMEGTSDVPLFTEQKPVVAAEKPVKRPLIEKAMKSSQFDEGSSVGPVDITDDWKSMTPKERQEAQAKGLHIETDRMGNRVLATRSMTSKEDELRKAVMAKAEARKAMQNVASATQNVSLLRGTKAVATLPNGTLVSGEVKGTSKDGKVEFRAFKVRKFGSKAFTPYPVNADGTPGFKDSFVDADKVRPIDASADVSKLSPEEKRKLKIAEMRDSVNDRREIRAGEQEAHKDIVDDFNNAKERKERRKTDNGQPMFRRSDASVDKLMEEVNRQDVADNFRALPSTDPKAREIQADVQVSYAYNLTRKTVQRMQDEARGVYEKNKTQAQLDLLAGKTDKDSDDINTDARRMAQDKMAVDDLTMDAVANPDDDKKTATAMLGIWRWYERGTDVARALRLRFDPVNTPEGRRAWILRTMLAPTRKEAAIIQRAKTTAEAIDALKIRAKNARKVMVSLKAKNIDISKLTAAQLMDEAFVAKIMQEISTARSGWGDVVHEWWRNAILSAPTTQIVNMVGNAGHAALEAFIQRPVEALINTVAKNDRAASFRSISAMYRAIIPSLNSANKDFLQSWKTEKPVSGDSAKVEESNAAIPTKFGGKIIRTPQRLMMATDEWFKTVFMAMLTADYATREFDRLVKEGNQKESNREDYVLAQVDKDSSSYAKAWEETLRWSFQQKPGHMAGAIMNWRNDPTFGFWLKFIFPFVKTPANIISTGIRKTPLNAPFYIYKAATGKYSKEDAFRLGAEQAVGMIFMSLLYGMMEGDDDDPLNRPRITGSKKTTSISPAGEKEAEAQDYPPMSVRVGDKWVSYARLEPFATMTATMVDALTAWKQAKDGKTADIPATLFASIRGNFSDKTFLQGVGNMVSMIEGDEFAISKAATSTLAGFNPNIIRSTVRAFDPYVRDTKANKGFLKKLSYQAMPSEGNAPSPKIDKTGQPIKKEGGGVYNSLVPFRIQSADKTTKIDAMVKRYNESVPKDDRWWPSTPSPITVRLGKEKIELTPEEFETYKRYAGDIAQRRLKSVSFNFDAPTESDMERLKKVYEKARDIAKDKIRPSVIRRFTKSARG